MPYSGIPSRHLAFRAVLPPPYDLLLRELAAFLPRERLITDPLRRLTWGTDASFYRLVPKLVAVVEDESEVVRVLARCAALRTPVTFRAAGTSLSGQAISDSVLVVLGDGWRRITVADDAGRITLQPGVVGAAANRALAHAGRKIGPDPASIDAAMIGGIAANNASGMCCGTAQNSYHTLDGLRVVLADGTVLDTRDSQSRAAFAVSHAALVAGLERLSRETCADAMLAARIRHKYRLKNTTGYSLNALVDYTDPVDILAHLMIGSEGTLGFISEITYRTVPEHAHKATALILFDDLETACIAVTRLRDTPVAAVELADRAALRSVEGKPGMPEAVETLGARGAALLVETRAADRVALAAQIEAIERALADTPTASPVRFLADAADCARLWGLRKGMFPSVGAVRRTGTTVIIEDVAFPLERLAEATLDLQRLLNAHGYTEAIIFGHALEGNLHFVFTQAFDTSAEIDRYARLMDAVCDMVVRKYDGSLKAEHGTGRNVAPFVELEWGPKATALMRRVKRLIDPAGLLNPGVILNDDPRAHLQDLKPLPAADPLVDKCIECGFCEPKCPSRGLTLSPRQRIVGWREIRRRERAGERDDDASFRALYAYHGVDTCAACGLCATACPVGIETGRLMKSLRAGRATPIARRIAAFGANHFAAVTAGVRAGLAGADALHRVVGSAAMKRSLDGLRHASGGRLPKWSAAMPRPVRFRAPSIPASAADAIVYFPSCAARTLGPQRGDEPLEPLPAIAQRVFAKAGYAAVFPRGLDGLCCGQPFDSRGMNEAADAKASELEAMLREASDEGRLPIVFDTSPCALRMKRFLGDRLAVLDSIEFVHDHVLPRVAIDALDGPVAIHPVCSVRKMGTVDKLDAIARRCSRAVVAIDDVGCCGFAGDKGFTRPELNEHALRALARSLPAGCQGGYSTSRTCEIGLSERSGIRYRSMLALVDACTQQTAER